MKNKLLYIEELQKEIFKRTARKSFAVFLNYVIRNYDRQWFHTYIAQACQALIMGDLPTDNLMVFVPPQHGKSTIVSECFPAWVLGKNPNYKIVGCSYSASLSSKVSRNIQRIMDDERYFDLFEDTELSGKGKKTKGYIRNVDMFEPINSTGFYKAVGVGGGLTGTPVDIAIIDDPVKDALEAYSVTYRERVWNWYTTVLQTRLHNKSKQLFIMTRWHDDDLAGKILKTEPEKWTVISIPAIRETLQDGNDKDPRQIGEALWENKHSLERLLAAKHRSLRTFTALYQQKPTVDGGNIVKEDWFKRIRYSEFKALRFNEPIHFFLDTAYDERKQKSDNDPSGIIGACYIGGNIYITCAQKVWKSFPDLIKWIPDFVYTNGYDNIKSSIRIEPKANGKSVVQQLEVSTSLNVTYTPTPTEGKDVRLHAVSPKIECGRVYLVEGDWNDEFIDEVCGFPAKAHDEYVDILGYAINYLIDEDMDIPTDVDSMFSR